MGDWPQQALRPCGIVLIHPHIQSRLAVVVDVDLTMLLGAVFLEWAAALIRSSDAHPPHHAGSFDHGYVQAHAIGRITVERL